MGAAKNNAIIDIKDLKKVVHALRDNWWIIVVFIAFSAIAAYFYSYKLPKIYAAKAQVLLQSSETYTYQQDLFKGLGIYSSYERVANEQRILTSTDLISQTVARLKLDVSYFIVGRIQTKEVFSGTPFQIEAQVYAGGYYEFPFTFKIIDVDRFEIFYEENEQKVIIQHRFGEPIINNNFYFLVSKTNAINKSTIDSFREITYQFVIHNRDNLVYKHKSNISVENLEYTAILEVRMDDENSDRARMFLDTLCNAYISNSLKSRIKVNENTINYIDKQLNEIVSILDSIEDMLDNFKEQKDILNLSKEEDTYYKSLTDYELQNRSFELQLKSIAYLKNYIISNLNKELLPPAMFISNNDAYLTKAINELYNYQVNINSLLFASTEKSTTVKEMEYKIELLRNDILKYLVNTEKAINNKIEAISGEISFYEGMLKGVPGNQRQILNIDRKLQVNEKMYLYLLEKRAETVIAKAGIISDISIIESAHSIGIVKPDMNKIYYSFISVGLLLASIIAFLRTVFFGKIQSIEQLRGLTQLPVIGEVFHSKEAKDSYLIVDDHPRSFVTESFRALRTNLEYLAPDVKRKVILITSNRPSAGKTFCSINLGSILAKGGKRVLLLEMDLHKPKVHSALKLVSDIGLSSVLIGKSAVQDVVIKSPVENLDIILSGPAPPNASELILSSHFQTLLQYARENYEYVVIDTPPLGIISDALVLMKYSDINLFILNTKHGSMEGLHFAHDVVSNNKIGGFAFVLNNVKRGYSKYYYKKYSHGYGSYLQEE